MKEYKVYKLTEEQYDFVCKLIKWLGELIHSYGEHKKIALITKYDEETEFSISSVLYHLNEIVIVNGEYDEYDKYVLRSLRTKFIIYHNEKK